MRTSGRRGGREGRAFGKTLSLDTAALGRQTSETIVLKRSFIKN